jgi:putative hydrolase of HD superfamily
MSFLIFRSKMADAFPESQVDGTIEFLAVLAKLKDTRRQGWVERKVHDPESVADHMYRMGVLAMLCPDKSLNRDHMIRMAICHDMGEALIGDITPQMKVPKEEKFQKEHEAIQKMARMLPGANGEEVLAMWNEYEAQATPEAKFVRDLDLLEMIAQAHFYEVHRGSETSLPSFYNSGEKIQHPWCKAIFQRLASTRPAHTATKTTE